MRILAQFFVLTLSIFLFCGCGYKKDPFWDKPEKPDEYILP
ncbi:hypothetical protein [Helicobacter muridarum]|nr:hypothetical protein [Helicobacter muridarum]